MQETTRILLFGCRNTLALFFLEETVPVSSARYIVQNVQVYEMPLKRLCEKNGEQRKINCLEREH